MPFVYHLCAPDFRGEVLYPLDGLRDVYSDIYLRERVKYEGRESVLEFKVPLLGVTWGATVNLSALDPSRLVKERLRLGVPLSNLMTRRVLRIPVQRITHLPAVRYNSATHWINSSPGDASAPRTPPAHEFVRFDAAEYEEVTQVPQLHVDYLRRQQARGERALGFVFVPHILVASPIDVSGLESEALPQGPPK